MECRCAGQRPSSHVAFIWGFIKSLILEKTSILAKKSVIVTKRNLGQGIGVVIPKNGAIINEF